MAGRNGATPAGDIIRLGDLTIRTERLTVERDGEEVILFAYPDHPTCPGRVRSAVQAARDRYRIATGLGTAEYRDDPLAWSDHVEDLLLAIIRGLTPEEAAAISGQPDKYTLIFNFLGWWTQRAEDDADNPPVEGEVSPERSTTELSSPNSTSSTEPVTG